MAKQRCKVVRADRGAVSHQAAINIYDGGEKEGRQEGFKRISLEVRPSNSAARSLYEKFGFKPAFVVRRYYADGEDALVYEKHI